MRRVVMLNAVSLDGYYAGPGGEIDWGIPDAEAEKAAHRMMQIDTLLLGRVTYQLFESHWPSVGRDPNAPEQARRTARELDQLKKVVFSTTLSHLTWENSRLVSGDLAGEVRQLKKGDGPDIGIFGSGTIVQQLAAEGLIDEYLILVTPVVLGVGKPLFKDEGTFKLALAGAQAFDSGNVMLHYTLS
jgi:dihydrofolate reductase